MKKLSRLVLFSWLGVVSSCTMRSVFRLATLNQVVLGFGESRLTALLVFVSVIVLNVSESAAQIQTIEHGPFTQMVEQYEAINRDNSRRLNGYRIQILATTDRQALEKAEAKFESLYPYYPSNWIHEPPYYKLRTGAFTDRSLATAFLYKMKRDFSSAYPAIVKDIRPSELLLYR